MKTIILSIFLIVSLSFTTKVDVPMFEKQQITGVFESYDGDFYLFSFTDSEGDEAEINFDKVSEDVLKKFNFKTDKSLQGKKFKITYDVKSGGDEYEDILTIEGVEKL